LFEAIRVFLAESPKTTMWKEFEIINMAFWQIDDFVQSYQRGEISLEDTLLAKSALNRWMLEELKALREG